MNRNDFIAVIPAMAMGYGLETGNVILAAVGFIASIVVLRVFNHG